MSILNRLEEIRINERLKKKEFEEIIGKSSGYIGTLQKNNGIPGSDVLIKLSDYYPNKYNLDWILTGEGEMLKKRYSPEEEKHDVANSQEDKKFKPLDLDRVRNEIRGDLKGLLEGMKVNFSTLHDGVFQVLQDTQKIQEDTEVIKNSINNADLVGFKNAGLELMDFLKQRK